MAGHFQCEKIIIKQIEDKFGVLLPRSRDGCAWPGLNATIPPGWSWASCWYFFTERQHREWDLCNKDFVQVDTTETLYSESQNSSPAHDQARPAVPAD